MIDHNTRDPAVWQRPSFARHDQHCSLDDDNLANHDGADILGGAQLDLLPPTTSGLTTTGPTPTGPAGPTTTASASGQRS